MITRSGLSLAALAALAAVLCATSVATAQFTYRPAGELVSGSGRGRADATVYVPGMRFPIERAPAYPNSQVWGVGGSQGPSGSQCATANYSYPWHDNYCESRSWTMPLCPSGVGHQGQDMRPSTCADNTHSTVSAVDGTVTYIGSYALYITNASGVRFDYLHMRSIVVAVGQRVTRGQRIGRVSNNFGGTPTTIHLHFNIRKVVSGYGSVYVPPYMSLVRAYEDLLGTPSCTPVAEVCDGRDNDCDGRVDDGVTNACGDCGPVPPEVCDGRDNDCDGRVDDGAVCEAQEVLLQSGNYDPAGSSDLDGDGRADACARSSTDFRCHLSSGRDFGMPIIGPDLSDTAGWRDPLNFSTLRMADIDGDGLADLCGRGDSGFYCWRSTGSAFGPRITGPTLSDAMGWNVVARFSTIRMADFDGDGRDDVCARTATEFVCYPSAGTSFGAASAGIAMPDSAGWNAPQQYGTIRMGDVNGDGRMDVCARSAAGMSCWLSDGAGFPTRIAGPAWTDAVGWNGLQYWSTIRLVDVNNDGRADLCSRGSNGYRCHISAGTTFGAAVMFNGLLDTTGWADDDNYSTIRLADVSGDGNLDLCGRANAGIFCWLWTGAGWVAPGMPMAGPELSDTMGWDAPSNYRTIRFADLNGDRRADVCARGAEGLECWLSNGTGFPTRIPGPDWSDALGWDEERYYSTIRLAGPSCRAVERCNGRDDDCDGMIDEGCTAMDAGSRTDSGSPTDASSPGDAGTRRFDVIGDGESGMSTGGCGCRTVPPTRALPGTAAVGLLALGVFGHRRRQRRTAPRRPT